MAQIKTKQIKLAAQGDLMIANASANGINLTVGGNNTVLLSNGTVPGWSTVPAGALALTDGDVFIGGASNLATEASATSEGQVVVADGSNDFVVGSLAADFVTFTANTANNIASTDVQAAVVEVAGERSYIHTAGVDPTVSNDGVDTGSIGVVFKIGDIWVNTATDNVWSVTDVTTSAAVWVRSAGVASAFVYKGDLDAGDAGDALPSSPVAGDWYRISASSGTENFNGAWDAAGEPDGATFNVGDAIVFGDDGDWHKIDNTDPVLASSGDSITVTGGPTTYTINVNADEATITATGGAGTELAVFDGLVDQVLLGQGSGVDADWGYVEDLRDSSTGALIIDGVSVGSSANYLTISNATTGDSPSITATSATDTNIDIDLIPKGTGDVMVPSGYTPDDPYALVTKTYVDSGASGGIITYIGDSGGSQTVDIDTQTFSILGTANEVETNSSGQTLTIGLPDNVIIGGTLTVTSTLTLVDNDNDGSVDIVVSGTVTNIDINLTPKGTGNVMVPSGYVPDDPFALTTKTYVDGVAGAISFLNIAGDTGTASADIAADTITFVGGEAIVTVAADTPDTLTIDLDIDSLTPETTIDAAADWFVFYDDSAGVHRKANLDDMTNNFGGQTIDDDAVATGGVNEVFTSFFANTPINDESITVFFNGVKLRATGWTRSGTNLVLVDSVNGYAAESGDIISSRSEF